MSNVNIDEGAGREVALLKESGFWGGAPEKIGITGKHNEFLYPSRLRFT